MKTLYRCLVLSLLWLPLSQTNAQTTFEFIPSELTPAEDGYFLSGITYDFDDNGTDEHIQGCPEVGGIDWEDYERRDPANVIYELHSESDSLESGFEYYNCMVMPVCNGKYAVDSVDLSTGYVQVRPLIDTSDVALELSYIQSPPMKNLVSIYVETSPDVSINTKRQIPYFIEISLDGGETYDSIINIVDHVGYQAGYSVTYDAETSVQLRDLQDISSGKNFVLRFTSNYDNIASPETGQYVKFHKIIITADEADAETGVLANDELDQSSFIIKNGFISIPEGEVSVYRISGQFVGRGNQVAVNKGLYIITTDSGLRKKIFIK